MTSKLRGGRQCLSVFTSSKPLAVQVGAEQGSADTELGGHSDSVSSPWKYACGTACHSITKLS